MASWKTLKIGGGGFCSGLDVHPTTGDIVCRIDVFGGYFLPVGGTVWRQLITTATMPAADCFSNATAPTSNTGADPYANTGIFEVRFAPSDATRIYMAYNGYVFVSSDAGVTWTRGGLFSGTKIANMQSNIAQKAYGQKMAVDPANKDVVYLGTAAIGLYVSTDAAASWTQVSTGSVPVATSDAGITAIAFDSSFGTQGSGATLRTKKIYASSGGHGVYQSTDAGSTWVLLSGGPTSVGGLQMGCVSSVGTYYGAALDGSGIWKYTGSWTDITPTASHTQWNTIAVNPFDATHLCAVQFSAHVAISHNSGTAWDATTSGTPTVTASDVPYFINDGDPSLGESAVAFDPLVARKLWMAGGTGMYYTQLPSGSTALTSPSTWIGLSAGQETLVANLILSPPGGYPILCSWDRPTWTIQDPDNYQANYGPNYRIEIVAGWSADYAKDDNTFIAALNNFGFQNDPGSSAYSTNKGVTWTQFTTQPFDASITGKGGCIAASTTNNFIAIVPNDAGKPLYTLNRGVTWNQITIAGVPTTGELGWNHNGNAPRQSVTASATVALKFYMFNYMVPALYQTVDGGVNWTTQLSANIDTSNAAYNQTAGKLRSVPTNVDGHLLWCSGPIGSPGNIRTPAALFRYSTNGGTSFSTVPNMAEVQDFGFGAIAPGGDYPTVFAAGWLSGVYGIWQSFGTAAQWAAGTQTWSRVGGGSAPLPLNWTDWLKCISGDMNVYGKCYVGYVGSGFAYYSVDSVGPTNTFEFSVIIQGTGRLTTKMVGY